MPRQERSTRRWHQFTLRTLLFLVAAAALCATAWRVSTEPYRYQRETMALIAKLGGTYKATDASGWIRWLDKHAQDITFVDLADCDVPDTYLPHLVRLPQIKTLVVGGHAVADDHARALRSCTSLRAVVLDSTGVSEEGVACLKEALPDVVVYKSMRRACMSLKDLRVSLNDRIIYDPPSSSTQCNDEPPPQWLRSEVDDLHFANSPNDVGLDGSLATDAQLVWLRNLPSIRGIIATKASLDGSFLAHVAATHSLNRLYLNNSHATDSFFRYVAGFSNLTLLDISETSISDEGLTHISQLHALENVNISGTHITDAGIKHLAPLSGLRFFDASRTPMSDAGFEALVSLPMLETLIASDTHVTDQGLSGVMHNKNLKYLFLDGTRITDDGVIHLQKCAQLAVLSIARSKVSPRGTQRLKMALAQCEVRD
jgi:Leucine-rich repeat (LRR) protein